MKERVQIHGDAPGLMVAAMGKNGEPASCLCGSLGHGIVHPQTLGSADGHMDTGQSAAIQVTPDAADCLKSLFPAKTGKFFVAAGVFFLCPDCHQGASF